MSDAITPICPRCSLGLHQASVAELVVHGCGRCGGIWLDNQGSTRVLQQVDPQIVALAQQAGFHARGQVDEQGEAACPQCRQAMRRVPGGDPSVQVDICQEHGTWFDRNELQQVSMLADRRRRQAKLGVGAAGAAGAAAAAVALAPAPDDLATMAQGAGNLATSAAEVLGNVGSGIIEVGGQIMVEGVIEGAFSLLGAILTEW